jgi:hypothetical protein
MKSNQLDKNWGYQMTKSIFRCFIGMAIVISCSKAFADHPTIAFGINGAGPINTIAANTLPRGAFALGIQTELITNNEFSTEKLAGFADSGLEGDPTLDLSVNFGLKFPTGETNDKDSNGVKFETEFQPGSGSWDYVVGVAVSKRAGSFSYHSNILYNKTNEGSQATEIGDSLSYNAAVSYRFNHNLHDHHHDAEHSHGDIQWDLMLELNGEKRGKNKLSGNSEQHTGGNTIFLSPGFRVSSGKFGGFLSVSIPLVQHQNGEQADIDNRIVSGITYVF